MHSIGGDGAAAKQQSPLSSTCSTESIVATMYERRLVGALSPKYGTRTSDAPAFTVWDLRMLHHFQSITGASWGIAGLQRLYQGPIMQLTFDVRPCLLLWSW